ncbi:MAG: DUF4013 domain-containing protein [Chloroflexi bacterium]|nr:DUF4013 domain-containing protein [Chloroflexota bacterium]
MSSKFTSENLQNIFGFPFKDEKWKPKFAVGAFIAIASIFIIPGFFLGGYFHEIMRRIIVEKAKPSLPEWDDAGKYFKNGLKMAGVGFVYSLPSLLLTMPYILIFLFIPFLESMSNEYISALSTAMPISLVLMLLGSLIGMVTSFLSIVALGHMVAKDEFSAAFRICEWWPIFWKNIGGYLLAFVILMGLSWLSSFIFQFLAMTIILCVVLPFIMIVFYFYLGVVSSVLFAETYNEGVQKMADAKAEL